ncbi:MAG: hypothetical protein ACFFB3_05200 [Candidatus Hodarchaeota archaeon]
MAKREIDGSGRLLSQVFWRKTTRKNKVSAHCFLSWNYLQENNEGKLDLKV